ncbi:protein SGT1 homolog [Amphiura filiformis]|uniref:protein SGT1 homolog n=1 Tax=Amphiura filiformis TaxID=82378 RepID=UPI003B2124FB
MEPSTETEVKGDAATGASENSKTETAMPAVLQKRYDWYQTDTQVVIAIMIKKANKDEVKVDYTERAVSATVKLPGSSSEFSLELDLAHPIVPDKSITKVLGSKIELKMKKAEGLRWNKLEGDDPLASKAAAATTDSSAHKYPSSSHYTRNWDKVAKDVDKMEQEDKKEGDAAVNDLFQKIYLDGNDEVKKAMNKSFQESGGTVLSTNWDDIEKKKTDIKPPDGMEYKQYEI